MDGLIRVILLVVCVVSHTALAGQDGLCEGSLGENIFPDGDFGEGVFNLLQGDPGIAPGYTYTISVPPDDGFYTITNDIGRWPSVYGSWLTIQDNSTNPNGYMMVVNASFSPGIFFERIVEDLCENTTYEFSADVINVIRAEATGHILPNVSFLLDDSVYYTTGAVPQNEQWQNVGFSFETMPGQESIKLTLRNNAPGGFGNDLALDNISFRPCGPPSEVTTNTPGVICEDATFPTLSADIQDTTSSFLQWQISQDGAITWTNLAGGTTPTFTVEPVPPGNYIYRFLHATSIANLSNEKCRIVSDPLTLEVVPLEYLIVDTICRGLSYPLGDESFEESGTYMKTFTSSIGCDSIVTLELTVVEDPIIDPTFRASRPSCNGWDDGSLKLVSVDNGTDPYRFYVNDELVIGDSATLPSGTYDVFVADRYGCSYTGDETVPVTSVFQLEGYFDSTLILGYSVPMNITSNFTIGKIFWFPTNGLACGNCTENVLRPFETTQYTIDATSVEGCKDSATFTIVVDEDIRVFMPNVFSPNFDGINDRWGASVDPMNVRSVSRVAVFDRVGSVLFMRNDIPPEASAEIWDGTVDGVLVNPGVYTYLVEVVLADDSRAVRSGTVTVVR